MNTITVYIAMFASADNSDIGGGSSAHWSREEAIESIRAEVMAGEEGQFDGEDAEWTHRQAEIQQMDFGQLEALYAEQSGDDYLQTCWIQEHTLVRPPDLSDPSNIEKFLQEA